MQQRICFSTSREQIIKAWENGDHRQCMVPYAPLEICCIRYTCNVCRSMYTCGFIALMMKLSEVKSTAALIMSVIFLVGAMYGVLALICM